MMATYMWSEEDKKIIDEYDTFLKRGNKAS